MKTTPTKAELWLTTATVVRNYFDYGRYQKNRIKAIKVISQKFPNENPAKIEKLFDLYYEVINEASCTLNQYIKPLQNKKNEYSEYQDVDFDKFIKDLKTKYKKCTLKAIKVFVDWTIYWNYLR